MTGLRFLFRVTLRRLDLAAEIYHLREPQKIPQVISPDEARRLLAVANSLRPASCSALATAADCVPAKWCRLKVKHIDSAQKIIRIEQSKGRKDRNVMLSPEDARSVAAMVEGAPIAVTMRERPWRNVGCFPAAGAASR